MGNAADTFALDVWALRPSLIPYARSLWRGDNAGADDGLDETVCRALANRARFTGGNLGAWMNRILRNIRCDQLAKGGRKGTRAPGAGDRLIYFANYGVVDDPNEPLLDLCDPESILIARETFSGGDLAGCGAAGLAPPCAAVRAPRPHAQT